MSAIPVARFGTTRPNTSVRRVAGAPQEYQATYAAHEKTFAAQVAAAKKALGEAQKGGDAWAIKSATERLETAEKNRPVELIRVSGERGMHTLLSFEAERAGTDAGHGRVVAQNATLWGMRFGHDTGRPMEAWLTDVPKDGKVDFRFLATPSGHNGAANFQTWRKNNRYVAEVTLVAQDGRRTRVHTENFKVEDPRGENASISGKVTLDVSKFKGGVLEIDVYAAGSAHAGGYMTSRRTRVHV